MCYMTYTRLYKIHALDVFTIFIKILKNLRFRLESFSLFRDIKPIRTSVSQLEY